VDNVASLVVRAAGDPVALARTLQRTIWSVNPNVPILRVETMDGYIAASAGTRRFVLFAIEAFAGAALLLAAIGLYGIISGGVTERLLEIGIRTAIGATPGDVVAHVVSGGLRLTSAGVLIGLAGAAFATRLLETLLFAVSPLDPEVLSAVVLLLVAISLLASWAPARRAASVDPMITLRMGG
jgi:putative ABC transport system permease protein